MVLARDLALCWTIRPTGSKDHVAGNDREADHCHGICYLGTKVVPHVISSGQTGDIGERSLLTQPAGYP